MTTPLDERTEALLGRFLLGRANEAEVRELEALRRASAELQEAMELLEGTSADFRRAAAGEELALGDGDLPDYLRPRELAEGLSRWFTGWAVFGAASATVLLALTFAATMMMQPGRDPARLVVLLGIPGAAAVAIVLVAGYLRRGSVQARVLEGGGDWARAVEAVRRQEGFFFSPAAGAVQGAMGVLAALLVIGGGTLGGRPGGAMVLMSAVALGGALVVAKRRFLLRRLRGPGGRR